MTLVVQAKVGKKYALYLPKAIVKALNLREGGRVILRVSGHSVILETLQDPLELALREKKFATITPEEVEKVSLDEQSKSIRSTP